jgi:hypothetical protein
MFTESSDCEMTAFNNSVELAVLITRPDNIVSLTGTGLTTAAGSRFLRVRREAIMIPGSLRPAFRIIYSREFLSFISKL